VARGQRQGEAMPVASVPGASARSLRLAGLSLSQLGCWHARLLLWGYAAWGGSGSPPGSLRKLKRRRHCVRNGCPRSL